MAVISIQRHWPSWRRAHQRVQATLFFQRGRQFKLEHRHVFWMQQFAPGRHGAAGNIHAEKFAIGAIDETHHALRVEHPDRHRQAVGQRAEARLAFGQLALHALALGDVHEQHGHPLELRRPHPKRVHRVPAVQRLGLHFKMDAVAG
ncbi:hypothetical protein FHR67_002360 [Xanthomonas arboricola]|nr:hypothetical protein [Xanthomonas campestris]